mgnify:CR=1 FL=1
MRADVFLASGGYAPSREQAKRLILEGLVTVDGKPLRRAAEEIGEGAHTVTVSGPERFVSRGGNKLEAALAAFGLIPSGWRALDIGASTGGFTDCLLRHGVAEVVAVDSGAGQLAEALRGDPRVRSREHCNARDLTAETIGGRVRLIVMDVSFISATLILPRFPALLESVGDAVCLIKPQFEAGKEKVGKKGVVRDPAVHEEVLADFVALAEQLPMTIRNLTFSPVKGPEGNIEFLAHLSMEPGENHYPPLHELVEQAHAALKG